MQDRVPLYPGRVTLTPVAGQENTYDMARADQPTKEGTPLNKATFLKDTTAALFGLGTTAVPDDVFQMLAIMPGRYKIGVHVTVNGTAASKVVVHGITNANGGAVSTNSSGYAEGYTYERTATLSVDKQYTDVPAKTVTVNTNGNAFTETTIALVSTSGQLEVTSSQTVRFSTAVKTVDIFAVGGGGSGAIHVSNDDTKASGGAGGYTTTKLNVPVVNHQVVCTIGKGGAAKTGPAGQYILSNGAAGGTTTAKTGATTVSAAGGSGGNISTGANGGSGSGGVDATNGLVGNGGSNGGNGGDTHNSKGGTGQGTTTTAFGENSGPKYSGAGGGFCVDYGTEDEGSGIPGADGGGESSGGYYRYLPISSYAAGNATVSGSGGGGLAMSGSAKNQSTSDAYSSGAGADGLVILRW